MFISIRSERSKELFQVMSEQLKNAGCVKDSFLEGITNREQEFPTGLEVNQIGFAIPHTDSAHVNSSQICFASLKEPLVFSDMTDKSHEIPVRLVFMLQCHNLMNKLIHYKT